MKKLALFASGSGTNVQNIVETFNKPGSVIEATLVICNNPNAYVLTRAERLGVESHIIDKNYNLREPFGPNNSSCLTELLQERRIDYIILAGFLLKIPQQLIDLYPDKIINIHPALLPKYGGKGMYGHHVHEAVIAAGEKSSGITVHLVNEHYDSGRILFQASCAIEATDTPDNLAAKIHLLEQAHFPRAIADYINSSPQGPASDR